MARITIVEDTKKNQKKAKKEGQVQEIDAILVEEKVEALADIKILISYENNLIRLY